MYSYSYRDKKTGETTEKEYERKKLNSKVLLLFSSAELCCLAKVHFLSLAH